MSTHVLVDLTGPYPTNQHLHILGVYPELPYYLGVEGTCL